MTAQTLAEVCPAVEALIIHVKPVRPSLPHEPL